MVDKAECDEDDDDIYIHYTCNTEVIDPIIFIQLVMCLEKEY